MPITLLDKNFTDEFRGDDLTFWKSNAGDKTMMRLYFRSNISFVSGIGISAFVDYAAKSIDSSVNFEDEGFRVGDTVVYEVLNSSGVSIFNEETTVTLVDGTHIELADLSQVPDVMSSERVRLRVRQYTAGGDIVRKREGLIVNFNQVPNEEFGTPYSLIDNEPTRFAFDLRTLSGSGDIYGTSIGKRSGNAVYKCQITEETLSVEDHQFDLYYTLSIDFANVGMFAPSAFDTANCLKTFVEFNFQSLFGEPFNNLVFVFNENADTGYYNEAYNNEPTNAIALTSINDLSIEGTTDLTVQIQAPEGYDKFGIGGCYLPKDSAYYKSKIDEQYLLSMFAVTQSSETPFTVTSETNPNNGASFDISLLEWGFYAGVYTLKMQFTPSPDLTTFLNTRDEGDRTFLIWVRIGEQNVLVAEAQAKVLSTYGGEIKLENHKILDHSENVQNTDENIDGISSDTEDDLAFVATFKVDRNSEFSNFSARIQAKNMDNESEFTLVQANFDLSEIPNIDGAKPIDLSVTINGNLPTTSAKINATLVRYPLLDEETKYGMKIYMPWINRWEYWLQQLNANNEFYGQKTKNWVPYANATNWTLQVVLNQTIGGFLFDYVNDFNDYNYDNSEYVNSSIGLYSLDESPLSVIPVGDKIIIESLHETQTGEPWGADTVWGMITVEPFESAQRWIASSVIDFDSNTSNPLSAISGTTATLDFIDLNKTARLRCYFDSNKINLQNGVKITAKIKGEFKDGHGAIKQERVFQKFNAVRFPQTFTEQNRGVKTCCDSIVVADTKSDDTWKNDVTSAWIKLSSETDTCSFYVLKDGQIVHEYDRVAFPNEPNAFYASVLWHDILKTFGVGCYSIVVNYSIAGYDSDIQWGEYELIQYSIEACLHQARIRAIFNSNQEIDGINFTGANVESTVRFYGFIGNRQPNTEVNNLIYNNREMRSVIRENLNEYEIITDPICDCLTKQIVDLFLLSENELFITDYNSFNHSYRYLDTPVILKETAQFTYNDLSRLASVRAVVADKFRNQRTFY